MTREEYWYDRDLERLMQEESIKNGKMGVWDIIAITLMFPLIVSSVVVITVIYLTAMFISWLRRLFN